MRNVIGSIVAAVGIGLASTAAMAQDAGVRAAYQDIEQTFGFTPAFFNQVPESAIAGAWAQFKQFQLNPNTRLSAKSKELIGLAVAAQIPCEYCVYFHTAAAKANGASEEEVKEAVVMASMVRHWSTFLNGMQIDLAGFKRDTDKALRLAAEKPKAAGKSP